MQVKKKILMFLLSIAFILTACQPVNIKKEESIQKEISTETKVSKITPEVKMSKEKEKDKIYKEIISNMSVEEKVGQLFLVRVPDVQEVEDIKEYNLGRYILFGKDFANQDEESVRKAIKTYQEAASIPLLIGVDQEGGTVSRLSTEGFTDRTFPSPKEIYEKGGITEVIKETNEVSQLLLSLGINLNFAPVADITTSENSFMANRTLGKSKELTSNYIRQSVETMNENNIGSVLKHFPGYGDVEDTHIGLAYDTRSYEEFEEDAFKPFEAGIKAGASMVLVSHNIVESIDPDYPASLSSKMIEILREKLNFNGIIITDDLDMGGIRDFIGSDKAAVRAIIAGNDIVVTSQYQTQIPAVVGAVLNGTIPKERLDESVLRVLELKNELALLEAN